MEKSSFDHSTRLKMSTFGICANFDFGRMDRFFSKIMFKYLSMDSPSDDIPWLDGKEAVEGDLDEVLSAELLYLEDWLMPTEIEQKTRFLTITKFANVLEYYYPTAVVIPQGSSATDTYLPTSDIDLIVTKLLTHDSHDVIKVLKNVSKLLWKHKLIVQGYVIPGARVPIIKCIDRCFGYHIDICVSNVNGVLNVPRVKNIMRANPMLRPLLIFMKLFVFLFDIDDPATGGFGSNLLINICLFALQSYKTYNGGREAKNVGQVLLYLMDVLGNKINYFLCGISTVFGGLLFSKRLTDQLEFQCPFAFVFEDPQLHDVFIGSRTQKTLNLQAEIKRAYTKIIDLVHSPNDENGKAFSILNTFLPSLDDIIERREQIRKVGELLDASPSDFASAIENSISKIWLQKETNQMTIFRNKVIDTTPEPPRRSRELNRSLSNPDGFTRNGYKSQRENEFQRKKDFQSRAPQAMNVWQHKKKKPFNKAMDFPIIHEMKKSSSFKKFKKHKKLFL